METPSLVMRGEPHFLSRTTLRPLGPSVTRTASASWFIPLSSARRACSSKAIIFHIPVKSPGATSDVRVCVGSFSTLALRVLTGRLASADGDRATPEVTGDPDPVDHARPRYAGP